MTNARPAGCGWRGVAVLLAAAAAIPGCHGDLPTSDSIHTVSLLLDTARGDARRARLIDTLPLQPADDPNVQAYRVALSFFAGSDRQPTALRLRAVERLAAEAPDALRVGVGTRVVRIDEPAVLARLGRLAAERGWHEWVGPLLARYARPMPGVAEADRPEAGPLVRLVAATDAAPPPPLGFDHPVDRTLLQFLARRGPAHEADARRAWVVLARRHPPADLHARLAAAPDLGAATPLARLGDATRWLDRLPATAAGWDRLRTWADDPDRRDAAVAATAGARRWAGATGPGVELRHLPVLTRTDGDRLPPPDRLRGEVNRRLAGRRFVPRFDRPRVDPRRVAATLGPADLRLLDAVLDAMDDPAVTAAWFTQADADHAEPTTEYGGVLTWNAAGRFVAAAFPTEFRAGDHKYVTPRELVTATHTGLAHYHFHAQQHDHADYAGPGRGDLDFTDALDAATLTLTFLDRDTLNVDLALPGRVVLDLGTVTR
ncbi:MAG: hypothetical protein AAF710_01850 [Planctomycetota bacterium]